MINQPTVFILVAGSSRPYGYPLGGELVRRIIRDADWKQSFLSGFNRDSLQTQLVTERMNRFVGFLKASRPSSIDAFLERFDTFCPIGKFAIAYILLKCQQNSSLDEPDDLKKVVDEDQAYSKWDDWHAYLFEMMGAPTLNEFGNNQVQFLTFNYDMSFDYALYNYIRCGFKQDVDKKIDVWNKLKPIHLHGSINPNFEFDMDLLDPKSITEEYRRPVRYDNIKEIAEKSIKIIFENEDNSLPRDVLKIMRSSTLIVFLGFGFHPLNMERLEEGFPPVPTSRDQVKIGATCYGLTSEEVDEFVHRQISPHTRFPDLYNNPNLRCKDWLRQHRLELSVHRR